MAIYTSGLRGPTVLYDSGDGLPVAAGSRSARTQHTVWAFGGAGTARF
ncbi:MAG TPA: hypothetical protein VHH15_14755 [Actinophytocola sp.]|nr:hypothetical protein [Actinophytocola sp.]